MITPITPCPKITPCHLSKKKRPVYWTFQNKDGKILPHYIHNTRQEVWEHFCADFSHLAYKTIEKKKKDLQLTYSQIILLQKDALQ